MTDNDINCIVISNHDRIDPGKCQIKITARLFVNYSEPTGSSVCEGTAPARWASDDSVKSGRQEVVRHDVTVRQMGPAVLPRAG